MKNSKIDKFKTITYTKHGDVIQFMYRNCLNVMGIEILY